MAADRSKSLVPAWRRLPSEAWQHISPLPGFPCLSCVSDHSAAGTSSKPTKVREVRVVRARCPTECASEVSGRQEGRGLGWAAKCSQVLQRLQGQRAFNVNNSSRAQVTLQRLSPCPCAAHMPPPGGSTLPGSHPAACRRLSLCRPVMLPSSAGTTAAGTQSSRSADTAVRAASAAHRSCASPSSKTAVQERALVYCGWAGPFTAASVAGSKKQETVTADVCRRPREVSSRGSGSGHLSAVDS